MKALRSRVVLAGFAVLAWGCATARHAVDLGPARQALEAARQAGAKEKAAATFTRAEDRLQDAERLAGKGGPAPREAARDAEWLARLALTEAQCEQRTSDAHAASSVTGQAIDQLRGKLRQSEDDERRLEERVTLLNRDLEMTETELIRTKARLKGIEGKSEASSAIAEAQILVRRLEPRGRTAVLNLCRESLAKAEQQLLQENYGAALFFAMKAQDLAVRASEAADRRPAPPPEVDQPAPQPSYTVSADAANIRKGPAAAEPVVGKAPRGTVLPASVVRGDWVKVRHGQITGWVYRPLLK
jgi:SH3 domain-containing protein